MTTGPAVAAASWHVKNGSIPYVSVLKATTKAGTSPSLKDVSTGAVLKCKKAFISGLISKSKSAAASPKLGLLHKSVTRWSSCTAGSLKYIAHLTTSPNLIVRAFADGVTTGKLSRRSISGQIIGVSGNTCTATVAGSSVPLTYTNAVHSLSIDPARAATLRVKAAAGNCHGQLIVGTKAFIHGTYHVSVPNALTISRS